MIGQMSSHNNLHYDGTPVLMFHSIRKYANELNTTIFQGANHYKVIPFSSIIPSNSKVIHLKVIPSKLM